MCITQDSKNTRYIIAAVADICSTQTLLHSRIYMRPIKQMPLRTEARDRSQTCHERLVVERVALRQVVTEYCSCIVSRIKPPMLHIHLCITDYEIVVLTWSSDSIK